MPPKSKIVAVLSLKPSARTIRTQKCKRRASCEPKKAKEKELEDLTAEFRVKRDNIIRQAVHAEPELVERAAKHIHSYIVRERLVEHPSAMEAYQKGGMVAAEINGILAAEFCQDLLAPVVETYDKRKGENRRKDRLARRTPFETSPVFFSDFLGEFRFSSHHLVTCSHLNRSSRATATTPDRHP